MPDVYGPQPITETIGTSTAGAEDASAATVDSIRFVHPLQAFRIIPDAHTPGYELEMRAIDEIEATAQGNGPALVELYFRIVHPSFPVLHKEVFLEKYARSYREFSPPLLAAVYLLASGYWNYSDSLAHAKRIDTQNLQRLAFRSLQETLRRPKISTLQAGLLLSQYQKAFAGAGAIEQQDRLTVQLVNLAHGLGIHLDCTHWSVPDWEISLRRRVGWGLFMQDKWTALLEGRPPLISEEDWEVEPLSESDFPENMEDDQEGSSEVERGRLVFIHMAQLSVLLADILRYLFSTRARRTLDQSPNPLAFLLELIKPFQIRLKDYFTRLPPSLKMDTAASMKLSAVGYLRLAYLAVEVCLHRHLLRTLLATTTSPTATAPAPDPGLAQICRDAARERFATATDFLQRLQAQHLPAFWYFGSAKCCALVHSIGQLLAQAAVAAGPAAPPNEHAFYARKLKELRWALKVNGEAGAFFMSHALALINRPVRLAPAANDVFDPAAAAAAAVSATTSPASMNFALHPPRPAFNPAVVPIGSDADGEPWGSPADPTTSSSTTAYLSDAGGGGVVEPPPPHFATVLVDPHERDYYAGFAGTAPAPSVPPPQHPPGMEQMYSPQQQQQMMEEAYAGMYHHQQLPTAAAAQHVPPPGSQYHHQNQHTQQQQQQMMLARHHHPQDLMGNYEA